MERLQKLIAASGICSRRQAEKLIIEGKVRVNGKIIRELGTQADPSADNILVNNKPLPKVERIVYLLNKPRGFVCSRQRQGQEKLVTELLPPYPSVYPVGRLDKESEGLLLLTNDGALSDRLTHPKYAHIKEYEITAKFSRGVSRPLEDITRQLLKGVKLGDGVAKADAVRAKLLSKDKVSLIVVVHEGRKHLLRRMCATVGLDVTSLRRTKFATLELDHLKIGSYRQLSPSEISHLREP